MVTDPALTAEPLAQPGTVIRRSRGTAAEQIAALPPTPPRRAAPSAAGKAVKAEPSKAAPREPKPDRTALAAAEHALSEVEARHRSEERALRAEEVTLAKRRRTMEREQADEREILEAQRAAEADAYNRAMRRWRG